MRVLVTGGTGVVGEPVVTRLVEEGHRVRLLSRHAEHDVRRWGSGVEPFQATVGNPEETSGAAEGCDAVLHIAGVAAERPPEITFERVNVEGTRQLLGEAERAGVDRFVFVSSLGAERGRSDYHRSKLAAEELVREYSRRWLILRPGNVYGPGDEVISLLLWMVRTLPAVPLVGAGDQPFQPVWAGDLAEALARAVVRQDSGEVHLLAGPNRTTMSDLLDLMEEITGRHPARIPVPSLLAELGADAMEQLGLDVPVTRDQLLMLQEGNVIEPPEVNALTEVYGVRPVALPEGLARLADAAEESLPSDGVGPLSRQRYRADIQGSSYDAAGLIRLVRDDFDGVTPDIMAVGVEPGTIARMDPGETITMELPLRGTVQVRVEEVTETAVTMATLDGHHLAGVIRFEARDLDDHVRFEICSYTRAGSWLDEIGRELLGKQVQKGVWRKTVEAVVARSGGVAPEGVLVEENTVERPERVERWADELVLRRQREE